MTCDAHLRWNFILLDCELPADHSGATHKGKHHETTVTWQDDDRRSYHGDDPGPCEVTGCVLPAGHAPDHAV